MRHSINLKLSTKKPKFAIYPRYNKDKYFPFVMPTFTGLYCDYDDYYEELDHLQYIDDRYAEYNEEVAYSVPLHWV